MFKSIIATIAMLFATAAFAVGPSQIWRLEISASSEGGIVEVAEVGLLNSSDVNTTDLIRGYAFEETVGSTTWTISHNLGIQTGKTSVDVVAVDGLLAPIEPVSVTIVDENTVEVVFSEAATGTAGITGISFDSPAANMRGTDVPVIEFLENRPGAAAFDGNTGSKFKSAKAPTELAPLVLQYTFWIGDKADPDAMDEGRWPNVTSYTITAPNKDTAPRSWKLFYWFDGQWKLADQKAAIRFENGETKTFDITAF